MRVCLSNSPECSGLVPCQACHSRIITEVIPPAMVAANLNADEAMARRFFTTYAEAWQRVVTHVSSDLATVAARSDVAPTLNGAEPNGHAIDPVPCKTCGRPSMNEFCSVECAERAPTEAVPPKRKRAPKKAPSSPETLKPKESDHGRQERKEDGSDA